MPVKKNHPMGGRSPHDLRVRPNVFNPLDFDEAIERHGQPVRWLKAQPCPTVTISGQHDLHCKVCHGRGEIYEYQREYWYYSEESPHGLKDPNVRQADKVMFWDSPVLKIARIERPRDGGGVRYEVVSNDETSAIIAPPAGESLPEYYEPLHCDYAVDMWTPFIAEFSPNGYAYKIPLAPDEFIAKVDHAKYKTLPPTIKVNSFNVSTVYLDVKPTDRFEIRGYKSRCAIMALMPFESMTNMNLKSYQHSEGDMVGICSEALKIGKGDVITSLVMTQRSPELLVRTRDQFDLMAYYDVAEIDGDIIDASGKAYKNGVDFILWDYNKIRWFANQPEVGSKYSINPMERLTWRVQNTLTQVNAAQGRLFPATFHLKKLTKNNPGTLQAGLKNEDRPVGDWSGSFRTL